MSASPPGHGRRRFWSCICRYRNGLDDGCRWLALLLTGWLMVGSALSAGESEAEPDRQKTPVPVAEAETPPKPAADESEETPAAGALDAEWTKPDRSALRRPVQELSGGEAAKVEVGVIVAQVGSVKLRRVTVRDQSAVTEVKAGDKVYAGDQFEVGKASALEMRFGMNARLRIGESSVMRVVNKVEIPDGPVVSTRRDMELTQGSARVRVKQNTHTPSPILLISGNVVMTMQQSDAILQKDRLASTVMVLNGEADVSVKESAKSVWGDERSIRVRKQYKIEIPGRITDALPKREKIDTKEYEEAQRLLTFSIDQEREKLPPAPQPNAEIEGP